MKYLAIGENIIQLASTLDTLIFSKDEFKDVKQYLNVKAVMNVYEIY